MATTKKTGAAAGATALPDAASTEPTGPIHKPFEWADPHVCESIPAHPAIHFFNQTHDLAGGAAVALEIIERCQLAADNDERQLLSVGDQSALMRFTIAALTALRDDSAKKIDWINRQGPGFKALEVRT